MQSYRESVVRGGSSDGHLDKDGLEKLELKESLRKKHNTRNVLSERASDNKMQAELPRHFRATASRNQDEEAPSGNTSRTNTNSNAKKINSIIERATIDLDQDAERFMNETQGKFPLTSKYELDSPGRRA